MVASPNNSIFVVGFPQDTTEEALEAFFESATKSTVTSVSLRKGRRRNIRSKTDDAPAEGTPFAFVSFESESAVQTVLNLIESKRASLGEFAANLKIEQVGKKDRASNSLYVTGFK